MFCHQRFFLHFSFHQLANYINHGNRSIGIETKLFRGMHNGHSLTLECGTPPDLKTRVEMVNCRSLAEGKQPEGVDREACVCVCEGYGACSL